jgi:murein DD-endopeptidase MepM/ murein hydrolase activator NlpD
MNRPSSAAGVQAEKRSFDLFSGIAWLLSLGLAATAIWMGWQKWQQGWQPARPTVTEIEQQPQPTEVSRREETVDQLPAYSDAGPVVAIPRMANVYTTIPERSRLEVVDYTVSQGDSVFGIAQGSDLTPETILWSNYDVLKDNPHSLSTGMVLKIPPTDGIYYQWQEGDSLELVAAEFKADVVDILYWPGNRFDLTNPAVDPGNWVMIPGGQRAFQQWIIPVLPRGAAGVSAGIYGGGACSGGYEGAYGSGSFIWPTVNHYLSGNDYWSGHLAIDIAAAPGERISAADNGVVVFAGWATGGYGYTVAIDHGNGYQTLYAHLSSVVVGCGQSVTQGQVIGYGGSTGNSTGPHLHFEIRYQGGFVNPWYVLPAP